MINSLPIVGKETPVSANDRNRLGDYATGTTSRRSGGRGLLVRNYRGGAIISPFTRLQSPPLALRPGCPFDITLEDDGAGALKCTFKAGTINSLLPDNYLTGITVPLTGTKYLVLNLTASNGQITGATFSADSSAPAAIAPYAGEPPVSFKILMGVCIDGAAVKVWACGNIQASAAESFRLQKTSPAAGQVPYDIYYTWSLAVL